MVIGSHNAWSFLRPKKWWMKLIGFTARCQHYLIKYQYGEGARCFDLHIRFDEGDLKIVHGIVEYDLSQYDLSDDLKYLNQFEDVYIRVLLDVRTKKTYTQEQINTFWEYCHDFEMFYPNIKFWCGRNLYNWDINYNFRNKPTCEEKYGSVTKPKWFWGIWPWLYAAIHNRENLKKGSNSDILLIDFVDINNRWKI